MQVKIQVKIQVLNADSIMRNGSNKVFYYRGKEKKNPYVGAADKVVELADLNKAQKVCRLLMAGELIAIDFDSEEILNDFLDNYSPKPSDFFYKSIGKGGGCIVFKHSEISRKLLKTNKLLKPINLDILVAERSGVLLPVAANKTKEQLDFSKIKVEPIPESVLEWVIDKVEECDKTNPNYKGKIKEFKNTKPVLKPYWTVYKEGEEDVIYSILRVLSHSDYKGYLTNKKSPLPDHHPDRIPIDVGMYDYFLYASLILATDISITKEDAKEILLEINKMLSVPYSEEKLLNILKADYRIWQYKEDWETVTANIPVNIAGMSGSIRMFKYMQGNMPYFLVEFKSNNDKRDNVYTFREMRGIMQMFFPDLEGHARTDKERLLLIRSVFLDDVRNTPFLPAGHSILGYSGGQMHIYNTLKEVYIHKVVRNPEIHKDKYNSENAEKVLKVIKNVIPNELNYLYFLRLLRRFITTGNYSPLIFEWIDGEGGSGKTFLALLLGYIFEVDGMPFVANFRATVMARGFQFTTGLDKAFAIVDEMTERNKRLVYNDVLKNQAGSSYYMHEEKFKNREQRERKSLIITTSNDVTSMTEDRYDRRVVTCISKGRIDVGEISGERGEQLHVFKHYLPDFIYKLLTEFEDLDDSAYKDASLWDKTDWEIASNNTGAVDDVAAKLREFRNLLAEYEKKKRLFYVRGTPSSEMAVELITFIMGAYNKAPDDILANLVEGTNANTKRLILTRTNMSRAKEFNAEGLFSWVEYRNLELTRVTNVRCMYLEKLKNKSVRGYRYVIDFPKEDGEAIIGVLDKRVVYKDVEKRKTYNKLRAILLGMKKDDRNTALRKLYGEFIEHSEEQEVF